MNPSILRNLTSEQWELLSGLIPAPKTGGRKRSVAMQAIALRNPIHLMCGLRVANAAERLSEVEDCIPLLPLLGLKMEHGNALHERLRHWVRGAPR